MPPLARSVAKRRTAEAPRGAARGGEVAGSLRGQLRTDSHYIEIEKKLKAEKRARGEAVDDDEEE